MRRSLSELFGRSPFEPLQEHGERVMDTVQYLRPLFEAMDEGDEEKFNELCEKINHAEHEADIVKNKFRSETPKWLFLPVNRRDLLELLSTQDSVADKVQDVAVLLGMRRLKIHKEMKESLFEYVDRVLDTCAKSSEIISRLDEILESSFGGPEAERVLAMIVELGEIEHESDEAGKRVAKKVFELEKKLDPVTVIMWSRVLTRVGDVANHAENIGNHLRLLFT